MVNEIFIYNYKIKSQVKASCCDLKCHRQAKLRTMKFFRVWLCAIVIPEPSWITNVHSHIVKNFIVLSLA